MSWNPEIMSAVPECAWPGLVGGEAAARLASLFQLEQSQWLPPEVLAERQLAQASVLLQHADKTIPFYRKRLKAAGVDPDAPLTPEAWATIPILRRDEVQSAGRKLLSRSVPKSHGRVSWTQTSGSTGQPVKVARTELVSHYWCVFTLRDHQWHERDFRGTLAAIRAMQGKAPLPDGVVARSWGRATHGLFHTGQSFALEVGASVPEQVEWLQRVKPAYLLTYPSNIQALAGYSLEHGIQFPGLRDVRAVGEIVTPAMREACHEAWGVPLFDTYSSEEFGYIALQCPSGGGMHIQSENLLAELLDEDDRPCAPGETGRLVITGLHNYAMPLIRYEIGDHAVAGERCGCGRGSPVLSEILGRTRNMLVKETGEQYWPRFGVRRFREIAPIRQYQAIQKTYTDMLVRLVVETPLTPDQEERLITLIQTSLESPFEIELEYMDQIPRSKAGKYDVFISEIS